jgi:lipoate---protein ligase
MMNKIYISLETDPYFNIAAEYQMFLEADEGISFFLWQNQSAVICGRNQNLYAECNMEYLENNHILPVRRFSGGGTVFQDMGNVNFTFIAKEKNVNIKKYMNVIKRALSFFDISCEFSGRNDLLYNGKKFSGHAYYVDKGNHMYHGTIMVNVDMNVVSKVLNPSFIKLKSKGIDSVRSRVINLSEVNKDITVESMIDALSRAFIDVYGNSDPIKYIDRNSIKVPLFEKINRNEWIFGQSPNYSISFERKLPCGNVTIYVDVKEGIINSININTDSLTVFDFSKCEKSLIGTLFNENYVFDYIEKYTQANMKKAGYNK